MPRALMPRYEPVATSCLLEALRTARRSDEPRVELTTRWAAAAVDKRAQVEGHWHLTWNRA